jgi:enamine deaminase RidA (YjgF/YER057c/UK114 family)
VVTSGQVGVDAHQALVGDGSFEAQVEQAFVNLIRAISAADCSARDVAKLTIYVVGYEQGKIGAIRSAVQRHFDGPSLPHVRWSGSRRSEDRNFWWKWRRSRLRRR